ncbi:hypothetical protein [Mesobacillus selenatarsenatis]|uniref:Uncharacterized protein n=1 Tax=Mesobacillus selenatarsenatis (strain DSM 18680 / JCM 14380 / FERM P-15431 / SF-1) TaxID=1321606 RepID=A0A0A8X2A2_MESS1|nr:hypothetical protein [Mesobacillus selenatarsenatis]GAM13162.1 hypothetical protein SAMD00020551_1300 [Mesobacillus selenatarsenatis SF-1]
MMTDRKSEVEGEVSVMDVMTDRKSEVERKSVRHDRDDGQKKRG